MWQVLREKAGGWRVGIPAGQSQHLAQSFQPSFVGVGWDGLSQPPMDQGRGPAPGEPMSLALCVPSWVWVDLRPPEGSGARLGVLGIGTAIGKAQVLPYAWSSPSPFQSSLA